MNRRNSEDASDFDLTGTAEDELGPFQAIAHVQRSSQRLDETIMWMTTWMTTSRSLFFRLSGATTMCDLDFDFAGSSKDTQRIERKPNTQLSSTVKPVTRWRKESLERTKFDCCTLNQEKHDEVTNSSSTGRPVLVDEEGKHKIDFRVPGLSHAVVEEAQHLRVQELVKKDRKTSSSRSSSCGLAAEQRLQPIQQKIKGDDPRIG